MSLSLVPNTNDFSQQSLFRMTFDKLPNVVYMMQQVSIPAVTMGTLTEYTPILDIPRAGDKLQFEPLTLNFIIQENLTNYIEIFNWMVGLGKPQSTDQHKQFLAENNNNRYSDATLTILTNKYNPLMNLKFVDCWPSNIGALNYDSTITESTPVTTSVTINYAYFTVEAV